MRLPTVSLALGLSVGEGAALWQSPEAFMKEYAIRTPRCPVQEILVDETVRREPQACGVLKISTMKGRNADVAHPTLIERREHLPLLMAHDGRILLLS
jgi:hypothetical protein